MQALSYFDYANDKKSPYFKETLEFIVSNELGIEGLLEAYNTSYLSTFSYEDIPKYDPVFGLYQLTKVPDSCNVVNWKNLFNKDKMDILSIGVDLRDGIPYKMIKEFIDYRGELNYFKYREENGFDAYLKELEEKKRIQEEEQITEHLKTLNAEQSISNKPLYESKVTDNVIKAQKHLDSFGVTMEYLCTYFEIPLYDAHLLDLYEWFNSQLNFLKGYYNNQRKSYYLQYLIWFVMHAGLERLGTLNSKFKSGLISPLVFLFDELKETKAGWLSPLFNYNTILYVDAPIDYIEIATNKSEMIWLPVDAIFLCHESLKNVLLDSINMPLEISATIEDSILKVKYTYDFTFINAQGSLHPFPMILNNYPFRGWDFNRSLETLKMDISLNDIYTLLCLKDWVDITDFSVVFNSDDFKLKNALFNAVCAIKSGDESYLTLLKREDHGLNLFRYLSSYIRGDDSLFGALLRYLAVNLGMHSEYEVLVYPMDIQPYLTLKNGVKLPLTLLIGQREAFFDAIKEADYFSYAFTRNADCVMLVENLLI